MHAKTILVTGGTGFTGSHLVRRLLGRGHRVRVIDNQKGLFDDELVDLGAEITIGSVTDRELLSRLVKGCEVVFHLAAAFRKINVPDSLYTEVNEGGMRLLLELVRTHEVRKVVYCSTQGVHGNVDPFPGDEDSPIAPEDFYQETKYRGEQVCEEFHSRWDGYYNPSSYSDIRPGGSWTFLNVVSASPEGFFSVFWQR